MIILLKLILAHLIGDFLLQPKKWIEEKEAKRIKSTKLYLHLILHGVLAFLFLWDLSYWPIALFVILLHGAIDVLKLYGQREISKPPWFFIDQILHLLSLTVLWIIWFKPDITIIEGIENPVIWLYLTALVFLTSVTGIALQVMLSGWSKYLSEKNESLNNAGKYIGMLERLFVFVFVVTDNWEAIGFLLAAKSVFRFGDLKDSKELRLTEYVLIGTLISFGIAIVVGIGVLKVTNIL